MIDRGTENFEVRARLRRWLSPSTRARVGRAVSHPVVGHVVGLLFRNRLQSGPYSIFTGARAVSGRTKARIFWGTYESAEIRLVHEHLRSDLDLLEIGSSLGVVSCHAVGRLDADRKAICVEANSAVVESLRANLAENHSGRDIVVVEQAIDYQGSAGVVELSVGGDTESARLDRFGGASGQTIDVSSTTLSALVSEHGLDSYVLISDIEGAEAGFIFGDETELAGCRQMIIELHDDGSAGEVIRWQDLRDELTARHGFAVADSYGSVHVLER